MAKLHQLSNRDREPVDECVFRREGEYWTIVFDATVIRLRDTRGLRYLACLLRYPGEDLHVNAIVTAVDGTPDGTVARACLPPDARRVAGLGDAGRMLDGRATRAYAARLADLREQRDDAVRANDVGRMAPLGAQIDLLTAELAAGARRAASPAERARTAVTKAVKAALERIRAAHPLLHDHLAATVRRGYFCSYRPDPRHPICWVI